jgi:hypothetical protein
VAEQVIEDRVLAVQVQLAALRIPGEPAPPLQVPADTAGDSPEYLLQLGPGRWRYPPERQPIIGPDVDPVEHQQLNDPKSMIYIDI